MKKEEENEEYLDPLDLVLVLADVALDWQRVLRCNLTESLHQRRRTRRRKPGTTNHR